MRRGHEDSGVRKLGAGLISRALGFRWACQHRVSALRPKLDVGRRPFRLRGPPHFGGWPTAFFPLLLIFGVELDPGMLFNRDRGRPSNQAEGMRAPAPAAQPSPHKGRQFTDTELLIARAQPTGSRGLETPGELFGLFQDFVERALAFSPCKCLTLDLA